MNKGKDFERELDQSRKTIEDMQKRISTLEAEKATPDGLQIIRVSAPANYEVQVADAAEQFINPGIDAPKFKCKHCREDRESMKT